MRLKPGALEWLKGRYIVHCGRNTIDGAVFKVEYEQRAHSASGGTSVLVMTPLSEHWPLRAGRCPKSRKYAIRNLPTELLVMSGQEKHFHSPIFKLIDPDTLATYTAPEKFDQQTKDQTKGKKTMSMNLKAAAAIVMEDVTTVKLAMGTDTNPQVYTYLIPREVVAHLTEEDVEKGAWVVREGTKKNSLAISQIVTVDDTPDIDLNHDTEWKWAFQLIDTTLRDKMQDRTEKLYKQLQDKQRERSQQGILAALGMTKDDLLAIEGK